MLVIVVSEFDIPRPDAVVDILEAMDPPSVPYNKGQVRIAVADVAKHVLDWLDEPEVEDNDGE